MVVVSIVRWAYWHQMLAKRSFGGPTLQGLWGHDLLTNLPVPQHRSVSPC